LHDVTRVTGAYKYFGQSCRNPLLCSKPTSRHVTGKNVCKSPLYFPDNKQNEQYSQDMSVKETTSAEPY